MSKFDQWLILTTDVYVNGFVYKVIKEHIAVGTMHRRISGKPISEFDHKVY